MKYQRILLKLSGESLAGESNGGIDPHRLDYFVSEIKPVTALGVQVAIVIGGGNIFRGLQGSKKGFDRQTGDYMGMLATLINSLALKSALEEEGVAVKLMSALEIASLAEKANGLKALEYLTSGHVVIFAGGTGNPYFTTDTASALRAVEIRADALLKGTRVDGVFSDDPEKNPEAVKFDRLSYQDAISRNLKVMDLTAFTFCQENAVPIVVFNMNRAGNLKKLLEGQEIGTIVS